MGVFVCPLCGNSNELYIGKKKDGSKYCRYCLSFQGEEVNSKRLVYAKTKFKLDYSLSKEQEIVAKQVVKAVNEGKNVLIHAICGAGKTELVYEAMEVALNEGKQVGFVIPRRDVVIELRERIRKAFPNIQVNAVYGGNTTYLTGDIIVLTAHQLYRYPKYFDLLIFDEIDAFPYVNNDLLERMFIRATKGNYIMLSATPTASFIKRLKRDGVVLTLFTRFHKHPLPVPRFVRRFSIFQYAYIVDTLRRFRKENKPTLVFVPTIATAETLFKALRPFVKHGNFVHSKVSNRREIIKDFVEGKYKYLVTTSVLERGVTIPNLQVVIYKADAWLYDEATIVQISGRVGRKAEAPHGEVILIGEKLTPAIAAAIKNIEEKNAHL